jgi:hypothetical protein
MGQRLGGKELYDCSSCAARPALRQMLGHDGPPTAVWREHLLTGQPLARCPVRDILDTPADVRDELNEFMQLLVPAYDAGHLLVSGGISDQPARYVEMITHIRDTRALVAARLHEIDQESAL